jgi:hypothetical protein
MDIFPTLCKAARVGKYKWLQSQNTSALFDLEKDIAEQNDLSKQNPETLKDLKSHFANWKKNASRRTPRAFQRLLRPLCHSCQGAQGPHLMAEFKIDMTLLGSKPLLAFLW